MTGPQPQKAAPFNPRDLYLKLVDGGKSPTEAKAIVETHKKRALFALDSGRPEDMEAVGFGTTVLMGFAQAASQGGADELAGTVSAAGAAAPGGVKSKSAYYAGRDENRAAYARGVAQHPWGAIVGEVAGTIATMPILAAALGMRGAQALPSTWAAAASGAKAAAPVGAVAGALNADELRDVPAAAAIGAGGAAVVGGLAGAVGNKAAIATEVNAAKIARAKSVQVRAAADEARYTNPERGKSAEAAHKAIQMKPQIAANKLQLQQQKIESGEINKAAKFQALLDYLKDAPDQQLATQLAYAEGKPGTVPAMLVNAMKVEMARRAGVPQVGPGSTPFVKP